MTPDGTNPDGPREGEYTFQYTPGADDAPCVPIVEAVAWVTRRDPLELDPLGRVLDVDALARLVTPPSGDRQPDGPSDARLRVTFEYEGCTVTLWRSGEFTVTAGTP